MIQTSHPKKQVTTFIFKPVALHIHPPLMAPVHTPCSRHRRPSWHHPCSQRRPTSSDCQRNQWPVAPIEVNNLLTFWMPWLGSCFPKVSRNLHPWNLTWNLKRSPWKRRFLLETIIFRFHVKFRGCIQCPLIGLLFSGLIILETQLLLRQNINHLHLATALQNCGFRLPGIPKDEVWRGKLEYHHICAEKINWSMVQWLQAPDLQWKFTHAKAWVSAKPPVSQPETNPRIRRFQHI